MLLIKNGNVYYQNKIQKLDLLIDKDIVVNVAHTIEPSSKYDEINANDLTIMPGLVDIHVHLREPGYEYKETIQSGTLAAAAGGFTTICCMPNLNPVTDSVDNIKYLLSLIKKDAVINVLPYASISKHQNGKELVDVCGLSPYCFAFTDDGMGVQKKQIMEQAMVTIRPLEKFIVSHCEDKSKKGNESEFTQLARDIELLSKINGNYHVCHVSTRESIDLIRKAKEQDMNITCEVTPHHLLLNDTNIISDGAFKMNPPLRSKLDQDTLIKALLDGTIDIIASDHAPHSDEEKSCGYNNSLNGIVGLETSFGLIYTNFVRNGLITFSRFIDLMSTNACRLFAIDGGIIEINKKANITIANLNEVWQINNKKFFSKGKSTPFSNKMCCGKIKYTIVNGKIVYQDI